MTMDQLKSNGFESLKKSDWEIITEDTEEDIHEIFTISDKNFISFQELEAIGTSEQDQAFYTSTKFKLPNPSKWQIVRMKWYQPVVLDFGNTKQIVVLNVDSSLDITIALIPLINSVEVISEKKEILETVAIKKDQFYVHPVDYFYDFDYSDLYIFKKDTNNKFRFYDHFGKDLLGVSFDKIKSNESFFVGQNGTTYTFYNSLLKPLNIPSVKSYSFNDLGIEVVTENGVKCVDSAGNEIQNFSEVLQRENAIKKN